MLHTAFSLHPTKRVCSTWCLISGVIFDDRPSNCSASLIEFRVLHYFLVVHTWPFSIIYIAPLTVSFNHTPYCRSWNTKFLCYLGTAPSHIRQKSDSLTSFISWVISMRTGMWRRHLQASLVETLCWVVLLPRTISAASIRQTLVLLHLWPPRLLPQYLFLFKDFANGSVPNMSCGILR